ncbi:unnamed protein product, partial [Rotaria sp. Silwood1]
MKLDGIGLVCQAECKQYYGMIWFSTRYANEITHRSAILKCIAPLILDLASLLTSHFKSFLTVSECEMKRDETSLNLLLKTRAKDVFDVFKRHCDINLITSIYVDVAKQQRTKRLER